MKKYPNYTLIKFFLIFICVTCSYAQSNQEKARTYFTEAIANNYKGNYKEVISSLDAVESILGSPNPMTLSLRYKAYFNLKMFKKAEETLTLFFVKSKNAGNKLRTEAKQYVIKLEKEFERERLAKILQARKDSIREVRRIEELQRIRLKKEKEKAAFISYYKAIYGNSGENAIYFKKDKNGNKKYGVVTKDFEILIDFKFSYIFDQKNGLAFSKIGSRQYGLINLKNGVEILQPTLKYFEAFNGKSVTTIRKSDNSYFLMNTRGSVISPRSDDSFKFIEGTAIIKQNKKFGLIKEDGKLIAPINYDYISRVSNEYFIVGKRKFHQFTFECSKNDLITYRKKAKFYGVINSRGKELIPIIHWSWDIFIDNKHNIIRVSSSPARDICGTIGPSFDSLYDLQGNIIRKAYGDIGYSKFSEGLSIISSGYPNSKRKRGYINTNGDIVIPIKYYRAEPFKNGVARVKKSKKGKWIKIDVRGKRVRK